MHTHAYTCEMVVNSSFPCTCFSTSTFLCMLSVTQGGVVCLVFVIVRKEKRRKEKEVSSERLPLFFCK